MHRAGATNFDRVPVGRAPKRSKTTKASESWRGDARKDQGEAGKGCLGKGCLGKGCLGKGCLGKGCLGKGCLGKGCLGNDLDRIVGMIDRYRRP